MPAGVARIMEDARASAAQGQIAALWEAEMARRVLAPLDCPVVLLKGTAFAAAGLSAGVGRSIGDLDILVPRDRIDAVEAALHEDVEIADRRSEEHTSELQSLMRISYAVFCLKKNKQNNI